MSGVRARLTGNAENAPKPQQRQVPQRTPQSPHTLVTRCPPDGPRCPAGLRPCGPVPRAGAARWGKVNEIAVCVSGLRTHSGRARVGRRARARLRQTRLWIQLSKLTH